MFDAPIVIINPEIEEAEELKQMWIFNYEVIHINSIKTLTVTI